ncbi:hypothetical protein [Sulfitobacter sp.]|uniref:hypothetical protein n=1 Tax=Sulfitobacter sp. TaxID=1903071 RepID=UPI0039E5D638
MAVVLNRPLSAGETAPQHRISQQRLTAALFVMPQTLAHARFTRTSPMKSRSHGTTTNILSGREKYVAPATSRST